MLICLNNSIRHILYPCYGFQNCELLSDGNGTSALPLGHNRGCSKCTRRCGGQDLNLGFNCLYVNKTCKIVVMTIMNNNSICSLSRHSVIIQVLCVEHRAMLVLATDSQGNSNSALGCPSIEVNV